MTCPPRPMDRIEHPQSGHRASTPATYAAMMNLPRAIRLRVEPGLRRPRHIGRGLGGKGSVPGGCHHPFHICVTGLDLLKVARLTAVRGITRVDPRRRISYTG